MNGLSKIKKSSRGPTMPILNGNWNPYFHPRDSNGEFRYNGGRHLRKASAPYDSPKTIKTLPVVIPYRSGYRRIGPHLVKTDEIPSNAQIFTAPNGKTFLAPSGVDFKDIYETGKKMGITNARYYIWQYGQFDFQRNGGDGIQPGNVDNVFYSAYTDASNYAAGVYMNGAGESLTSTLALAKAEAVITRSKTQALLDNENGRRRAGKPQKMKV